MPSNRPGVAADPKMEAMMADEPEVAAAASPEEAVPPTPALTPFERWQSNITEAGLSEEQANKILDDVLGRGYYERTYDLFRGRIQVVFRSRYIYAAERVTHAISRLPPDAKDEDRSRVALRIQMIESLYRYKGVILPTAPTLSSTADEADALFRKRADFIDSAIPETVQFAIYSALARFNNGVYAAFSEGAVDSF